MIGQNGVALIRGGNGNDRRARIGERATPSSFQTPGAKGKANEAQVCAADFEASAKPVAKRQRDQALERVRQAPRGLHRRAGSPHSHLARRLQRPRQPLAAARQQDDGSGPEA